MSSSRSTAEPAPGAPAAHGTPRSGRAALWRTAALGFGVLAAFDAFLLGYAWLRFAYLHPEYFADEGWPTFSRALSAGDTALYAWLAAVAGAGLFLGAASLGAMRCELAAMQRGRNARSLAGIACAAAASLLGIVHYFHVTISLSVDNAMHMLLSYTFFFGMTGVIAVDWLMGRAQPGGDAGELHRLARRRNRLGPVILAVAAMFLATYLLKDVLESPWADCVQRIFVCMEAAWIVLAHWYALLYVAPVRAHFGKEPAGTARSLHAAPACAVLVAAALVLAAPAALAAAPGNGLGGSGRIQPAGGVLAIVGPGGQTVETVAVRGGEQVRKGAVLLVTAERAVRMLERDLAAERLRRAQMEAEDAPRAAELEAEAARLALQQARSEAEAIAALDERTVSARERRQRQAAVAQAELALKAALARAEAARRSSAAELRLAQSALKLAEAALEKTRILAPMDATVLEVHVQPGSTLGTGPAVTLADTSRMYVEAEFFEGDLPKLRAGQRATATNAALGTVLEGTVERIGRVVDPVNRLARVWIRLARPSPADRFIGMQVDVRVIADSPAGSASARGGAARGAR